MGNMPSLVTPRKGNAYLAYERIADTNMGDAAGRSFWRAVAYICT
jgi:hypothetical protein